MAIFFPFNGKKIIPVCNKLKFVAFLPLYSTLFVSKCSSKYYEIQLMLNLFPYAEFCDKFKLQKVSTYLLFIFFFY